MPTRALVSARREFFLEAAISIAITWPTCLETSNVLRRVIDLKHDSFSLYCKPVAVVGGHSETCQGGGVWSVLEISNYTAAGMLGVKAVILRVLPLKVSFSTPCGRLRTMNVQLQYVSTCIGIMQYSMNKMLDFMIEADYHINIDILSVFRPTGSHIDTLIP